MYRNRFLQELQVKLVLHTCVKRYVHSDQEKMRSDCFERHDNFRTVRKSANRPFYRYGGHLELIRFKEYYRMPREHEHISFVFSSAFRGIFS